MVRFNIKRKKPQILPPVEEEPQKPENISEPESNDAFSEAFERTKSNVEEKKVEDPQEYF